MPSATTIGVLGGGQLGRMLGLAGLPLGLRFRFLDPDPDAPARDVGEHVCAPFEDAGAVERFCRGLDVCTLEFENVPSACAAEVARRVRLAPGPASLVTAQDRLDERRLFERLGVPAPRWAPVASPEDLGPALERVGLPAVLKARRLGYDGKGQVVVRREPDARRALSDLGGVPCLLDELVPFERELSCLVVRAADGSKRFYPPAQNVHRAGILRTTHAPAPGGDGLIRAAESAAGAIADHLGHVGVLAVEFFERGGALLANEIAPRVHNTGHWTIEGATTSQFENHLRAVLGLPLGDTRARAPSVMLNLIGAAPALADLAGVPGAHAHLYAKAPRPGRKLGHVTLCDPDGARLAAGEAAVRALIDAASGPSS